MSIKKGEIKSKRQHVLKRPDMYIGSIRNKEEKKLIYDVEDKKIIEKIVSYNEGLERIFIEILSNAIDNKWESEESKIKMTKISISVSANDGWCTISNDGRWIPIEKTIFEIEDERDATKVTTLELYPAESYFGHHLAGTNMDDNEKRKTSGKNGVGAKATNIFSKEFKITCVDPINGRKFVQTYSNNMIDKTSPSITKSTQKTGYTEISFLPDFEKFGVKGWTDDFVSLFHKHAFDCAMVTGLNVFFNGEKINIKTLSNYAELYLARGSNTLKFKNNECEVVISEQSEKMARKVGFKHISFVNGIYTRNGGVHVDGWINAILGPIRKKLNEVPSSKKNSTKIKVAFEQLKKYFFIFVRTEVDKPEFESQSKHQLQHPKPTVEKLTYDDVKKMMSWNFMQSLKDEIEALENRKIAKTDAKDKHQIFGPKIDDANLAGKDRRMECVFLITEGDSAKQFADAGIGSIENGSNFYGAMPLKGKPINASTHSEMDINSNKEIQELKNVLGLKHGTDYSKDEEFSKLRYGKVGLICDADVDGFHIAGLIMNYFYQEFPELIDRGYVEPWSTPAVKARLPNKSILTFYSHEDYLKWQSSDAFDPKSKVKYYKGLGTSTIDDASETFENQKRLRFFREENDELTMNIAFHKNYTNERKKWLTEPIEQKYETVGGKTIEKEFIEGPISTKDFIQYRLRLYHLENIHRAIPSMIDGLKESHRKILYTCLKTNLKESTKVLQLGGRIIEHSSYHHGDASLYGAIVKMAQGFVGSNNVPLFVNDGMFGSRKKMGDDAASPRYIFTKLEKITRKIFRPEDDDLLTYKVDDGKSIEPECYYPIVPLLLINGASGIGTGFSTNILSYNPEDLVSWIREWISQKESSEEFSSDPKTKLMPWYRGFKGTIDTINNTFVSKGLMHKDKKQYHITELPVGLATQKFKEYLEETLYKNRHITKPPEQHHTYNTVHFAITPHKDFKPDEEFKENLKLMTSNLKTTNMHALFNGLPKKYSTVDDIMQDFCNIRYNVYIKRKRYLLSKYKYEYVKDRNRYKFIKEVIEKTLAIYNRDEKELFEEMKQKGYKSDKDENESEASYGYLVNMSIRSMTKQKMETLKNSIRSWKKKIEDLQAKTEGKMWNDDLDDFINAYATFLKTRKDDNKKKIKKYL